MLADRWTCLCCVQGQQGAADSAAVASAVDSLTATLEAEAGHESGVQIARLIEHHGIQLSDFLVAAILCSEGGRIGQVVWSTWAHNIVAWETRHRSPTTAKGDLPLT